MPAKEEISENEFMDGRGLLWNGDDGPGAPASAIGLAAIVMNDSAELDVPLVVNFVPV